MYRLQLWIKSIFGFSRTETNAFIIMLPLMVIIIFSEPVYRAWFTSREHEPFNDQHTLDSLVATWAWEKKDSSRNRNDFKGEIPKREFSLFKFNPNFASDEEFVQLGLDERMARRIVNYRSKGGQFKIKTDLKKIYGIDSLWFQKVYAYIDLPEKNELRERISEQRREVKPEAIRFDLNKADTSQLIKIYGIGPKLAVRIIRYREKLGGFVSSSQLTEVYGLDSTVINQLEKKTFIEDKFVPVTLSLNRATEKELAAHPYVGWKTAKMIAAYRFQHGAFQSIDDLDHIKLIDAQTLQRIKPYLTLD